MNNKRRSLRRAWGLCTVCGVKPEINPRTGIEFEKCRTHRIIASANASAWYRAHKAKRRAA